MVSNLKHKRSAALLTSLPFPTSSSALICDSPEKTRWDWTGSSLAPRDGYSGLFTSGLLDPPPPSPRPTLASPLSPSSVTSAINLPPHGTSPKHSLDKTPPQVRPLSTIPTTSSSGPDIDEQSLDIFPVHESRWSSSSEENSDIVSTKPRKSTESTKSKKSVKSGKSEDADKKDIEKQVPPVPAAVPLTPGRSRRVVDGLVKRLGLTPRRNRMGPPPTAAPTAALPSPPLPLPTEKPRTILKKGSLSTLRSALSKKGSTNTLRSVRSNVNPFSSGTPTLDQITPPLPLPQSNWRDNLPSPKLCGEQGDACLSPTTPRREHRTPKTSIGQPRLQPSSSPSVFLKEFPRRAPGTPKKEEDSTPPRPRSDSAYPIPVPDLVQTPGDTTFNSMDLGTPVSSTIGSTSNVVSQPLTARADSALKPKRLLNLLPRQQKINLGLQTPPSGRRTKKSTGDVSALLNKSTPLQDRSDNGLATPSPSPYGRLVNAHSYPKSSRDPLYILRRFDSYQPRTIQPEDKEGGMPFRSGAGDGWSTPALSSHSNKENEMPDYFVPRKPTKGQEPIPKRSDVAQAVRPQPEEEQESGMSFPLGSRAGEGYNNPDLSASSNQENEMPDYFGLPKPPKQWEPTPGLVEFQREDEEGEMPCPSGTGSGGRPAFSYNTTKENENEMPEYFGMPDLARTKEPASAFDFSASPEKSVREKRASVRSTESEGLPSEEWELEAFLRELEKGDRDRPRILGVCQEGDPPGPQTGWRGHMKDTDNL